jgi:phage terminase large subunit-like protein
MPKAPTRAERNIRWIEKHCRVPEGKDVGKPVKLRAWQKRDLRKIYDNPHGTRLAIISFAKKNGKSSLAACLLLLHLCGPEARPNSQIPSTATSKDQAAVLFALAAKMVRMSKTLDDVCLIRDTAKQILCPELGTFYKALSADATTAHGQSPVFAIHDELGQVRGPVSELFNAIENAMGAHEEPMSIIISTQAPTDGDLLSILIDDALAGRDPHTVISLYTAEDSDKLDPFSLKALKQANPALGDFLNQKEVMKQAADAKALPSQEALYRNYTLNQRVDRNTPFIAKSLWQANGGKPDSDWEGRDVYAGLDLSSVADLTSFERICFVDGAWEVRSTFWLPGANIRQKSESDRVPYNLWAEQGHLDLTPGRSVDYKFVADFIWEDFNRYLFRHIAFDRWNMRHLKPWLKAAGFREEHFDTGDPDVKPLFVEFGQGFQSMSPALRDLEGELLEHRLRHGDHPVLAMCAANAVVTQDPAGNRKLNKQRAAGRIDGMVALTMAFGVAPMEREEPLDVMAMVA